MNGVPKCILVMEVNIAKVSLLFSIPNYPFLLKLYYKEDGRILILKVVIEDLSFLCANVYAPNDTQVQVKFFSELKKHLERFHGENIIMGGDFNCPLSENDKERGRDTSFKKNVIEEMKSLISFLNLEDVW